MEQHLNQEQIQEQLQALEQKQEALQEKAVSQRVSVSALYAKIRNIVISMVALVFVTVMFYSASTFSSFSDDANSGANKITAGSLDMELIEMTAAGSTEVPFKNPVRVVPSLDVSKIVRVKNTGTLPMIVRVKVAITINKDESALPPNWRSLISCNFNVDNNETGTVGTWELRDDGYYYYILPLEAGKVTTDLFDTVSFSPNMGNEFTNSKIELTVTCEATQLDSNVWPKAAAAGDTQSE